MADIRRRKRATDDSEDLSEESGNEQSHGKEIETESEVEKATGPESDYESAEEEEAVDKEHVLPPSDVQKTVHSNGAAIASDAKEIEHETSIESLKEKVPDKNVDKNPDRKETVPDKDVAKTACVVDKENVNEALDLPKFVEDEGGNEVLNLKEIDMDNIISSVDNSSAEKPEMTDATKKDVIQTTESVNEETAEVVVNIKSEDKPKVTDAILKDVDAKTQEVLPIESSINEDTVSEVENVTPTESSAELPQLDDVSISLQKEMENMDVESREVEVEIVQETNEAEQPNGESSDNIIVDTATSLNEDQKSDHVIISTVSDSVIENENELIEQNIEQDSTNVQLTECDEEIIDSSDIEHEFQDSLSFAEEAFQEHRFVEGNAQGLPLVPKPAEEDITSPEDQSNEVETSNDHNLTQEIGQLIDIQESSIKETVIGDLSAEEIQELVEPQLDETALVDGTEESSSLEGFCGGSTSGDLLDEEGGMEGAAEVEEDCQFLEEDEEPLGDDDDEGREYVEGERQQGDGEESVSPCPSKEKKLDDDEDRRNPQYIPKKGSFYEHDDRAGSEAEEEKEQNDKDKKKTKKLWSDDGRWGHDMFREEEQAPKSREELVSSYGYDIRSEDGPPRARRRRRYGRGPNKYTRNWQDEDAYFKGAHEGEKPEQSPRGDDVIIEDRSAKPSNRGRAGFRGGRSFRGGRNNQGSNPQIDSQNNEISEPKNENAKNIAPLESGSYATVVNKNNASEPILIADEFPALPSKELPIESTTVAPEVGDNQSVRPASPVESQVFRTLTFENSRFVGRSDNREGARGRGRSRGNIPANQERPNQFPRVRRGANKVHYNRPASHPTETEDLYDLQAEMEKMKLQESAHIASQQTQRKEVYRDRLSGQNPEIISNQRSNEGRPKRYSSLRQRGVQEPTAYHPPMAQTQQYYEPGFRGPLYNELPSNTQHQTPSAPAVNTMMTPTFPANFSPAAYQEPYAMRAPMPSPPRLYHPPTALPPGPGQPVVASPYMGDNMVPGGPMMNYAAPPPPHPTAAYPTQFQLMQSYPGPQPPPPSSGVVPQTHEMFSSGITYYSPHGQQFVGGGRALPLKRPKAAIPIVPPPDSQFQDGYEMYDPTRLHGSEDPSSAAGVLEVES